MHLIQKYEGVGVSSPPTPRPRPFQALDSGCRSGPSSGNGRLGPGTPRGTAGRRAGAQLTCQAWRWHWGSSAKGQFHSRGRAVCALETTALPLSWKPAPYPRASASTKLPPSRPGLLVPAAVLRAPLPGPVLTAAPRRGSGAGQPFPGEFLPCLSPDPAPTSSGHSAPGTTWFPAWGSRGVFSSVTSAVCHSHLPRVFPRHPLCPSGAARAPCRATEVGR